MPKLAWLDSSNLLFFCPGCKCPHYVRVSGSGPLWEWNGSLEEPTLSPAATFNAHGEARCHFVITAGYIEFLSDSHHSLKGSRTPLPVWVDAPAAAPLYDFEEAL